MSLNSSGIAKHLPSRLLMHTIRCKVDVDVEIVMVLMGLQRRAPEFLLLEFGQRHLCRVAHLAITGYDEFVIIALFGSSKPWFACCAAGKGAFTEAAFLPALLFGIELEMRLGSSNIAGNIRRGNGPWGT
jgi:hypothetical protein